ncbi:TPA: hypothetical protein RZK28_001705 [Campylobacter coli]|nr:hypothetical protein [Campylobacter coli]
MKNPQKTNIKLLTAHYEILEEKYSYYQNMIEQYLDENLELATQYSEELAKIIKEQKTVLSGIKRLVNLGIFQKAILFLLPSIKNLCYNTKENICKDILYYANKRICFKRKFQSFNRKYFF